MSQETAPEISKQDFVEWKNSHVTKFIVAALTQQASDRVFAVRSHVRSDELGKAQYDEGFIAGLYTILDIDYEDVEDES